MKIEEIKELIDIFNKSELTCVSIDDENGKLTLEKNASAAKNVIVAESAPVVQNFIPAQEKASEQSDDKNTVRAMLVGIAYRAPNPDSEPFVKVGDKVKKGQPLCVIEAMKMFNDITAPKDCTIDEICFEDGTLVEYDAVLFRFSE